MRRIVGIANFIWWTVMFTLPFVFVFADPSARPIKFARSGWLGGVNDFFVLLLGSALGRIVFCGVWLLLVAALFYGLEIRRSAMLAEEEHEAKRRAGSPFSLGRLRGRPSRAKQREQKYGA
jgi:hypothetical protein